VLTPDFGHWLAGMTDGEGSFALWFHDGICEPTFNLGQRSDNLALLIKVKEATGLGYIRTSKQYSQKNPMSTWVVRGVRDCTGIISLFRIYPLRGTKAEVFDLWSIAVEQFLSKGIFPPRVLHEAIKAEVFDLWSIAVEQFLSKGIFPPRVLHEAIKARKHFRLHKLVGLIPRGEFERLVREIDNDELEHLLENQINAMRRP